MESDSDDDDGNSPCIQGYEVNALRERDSGGRFKPDSRSRMERPPRRPEGRTRVDFKSRKKFPEPDFDRIDKRRGKVAQHQGTCDACGLWGHKTTTCHFLAMYSYVLKYWKDMSPSDYTETMRYWTERNQRWVDNDRSPRCISRLYCENVNMSMDQVSDQMDWNFFDIQPLEDDSAGES